MSEWFASEWLDILTTILGLIYIWLEYRASIWLWSVGILMPMLDIMLYWQHGLYGDSALAVYYMLAAVYGLAVWIKTKKKDEENEMLYEMPKEEYRYAAAFFFIAWISTWFVLKKFTNSEVPVLDGFTNAMSFVALWALSRKYAEQWLFWLVVDAVCCYLYIIKGIPFKAGLYGLYVFIAIAGYLKWKKMCSRVA